MKTLIDRPQTILARLGFATAFLIAMMAAASLSLPQYVDAQEPGTITGTVTNHTTGEPVPDTEVILSKFADQTGTNREDTATTTDANGVFSFEDLDTSDGLAYAVSTRYRDVTYSSTAMILLSQTPQQTADIVVYDTTTDQLRLSIPTRALIFTGVDRETGELNVTDAYTLELAGDETLIDGPDGYSVQFPVPANVAQITPRPGFDFGNPRIEETSVLVTTAIRPGETGVGLDYVFRYTGATLDIPITAGYPTATLQILVPTTLNDADVSIQSADSPLLDGGVVAIGGRDYHVWSATSLNPDTELTLAVTGLPQPPTSNQLSTIEPAILAGLALIAATAVTGWVIVKRGLHRPRPVVLAPAAAAPLDERRAILSDDLRNLQLRWEAGDVDDITYQTSRKAILEDLRRISRQYRGLGDDE